MGQAAPRVFLSYNSDDESVANQVRRAILAHVARGGSYTELAEVSGLAKQQIGRFVRGERDLTLTSASRVMSALGTKLTLPERLRSVPPEELTPRDPRGGRPTRVGDEPEVVDPGIEARIGGNNPGDAQSLTLSESATESPSATPPSHWDQRLEDRAWELAAEIVQRCLEATIEKMKRA